MSAVTLSYVDELWRSLAEEFDLSSLTAVIHSIIEGSLVVTWLVLPHIAEKIITSASTAKAVKFFRRHGIVSVEIDNDTIYDEEQMVRNKKNSFLYYYSAWIYNINAIVSRLSMKISCLRFAARELKMLLLSMNFKVME